MNMLNLINKIVAADYNQ